MRGDKETFGAGLLLAATATISCAAQQELPAPREIQESTGAPADLQGGESRPSCSNGRLSLRERFRGWKQKHQEAYLGYPEEFNERPLGAALHDTIDKQRANGEVALMVLYHQDFGFGPDQEKLNARGRVELEKIVRLLPRNFAPVVIERSANPQLDERRRQTVFAELQNGLFPVPPERVIVAPAVAYGVRAVEADLIGTKLLNQTESRGQSIGAIGIPAGPVIRNRAANALFR